MEITSPVTENKPAGQSQSQNQAYGLQAKNKTNLLVGIERLNEIVRQVRRDILRMTHAVQSGHPGGSLGCAEFLVALYFKILHHSPEFSMEGRNEDIFFLSNGHISPAWYSVLARSGYFNVSELATFRKISSRLQGHPSTQEHLPGIRVASGSLGQGLSVAIGAAQAKKINNDKYLVYSLLGDGELQEGQIWEAAMYAAHNEVDNIIATIDWNGQQIDGPIREIISLGDLKAKWLSFGWDVIEMYGNDIEEVLRVLEEAKFHTGNGKPIVILMKTHMGYPIDFMIDNYKWHGVAPNDEQLQQALSQLGKTTLGDY